MKAPAFQFYPSDFMMGTIAMTAEEVGGYIRLLCFQWEHGPIPNDDSLLIRITGCGGNAVASIRHKFQVIDGKLANARLEKVRAVQVEYRKKQAENASKRWVGNAKPHAVALPTDMPNGCSPSLSSSSEYNTGGAGKPRRTGFVPPLAAEIEAYSTSIGYPMNGASWCDSYAQKGWMVGRGKMKDWKAAVRNWKANKWLPNRQHISSVSADFQEPEDWKNYWRTKYPPEDCPEAPRYEDGQWSDVRRDHKQEIIKGMAAERRSA